MPDHFTLAGSTALVTGGGRRIGKAIALSLADEGANVIIHYNSSGEQARALGDEITAKGVNCWALQADLGSADGPESLAGACLGAAGPVHVVVNNASTFSRSQLSDLTHEHLARNMQVHALGPLIITRILMGQLPEGQPGRVVNMTDAYAGAYQRTHVGYNLSKRALLSLTQMMALELAPNVTVNAVAPGMILPSPDDTEEDIEALVKRVPLRRLGETAEVVQAVLYLINASFVTGQAILVDGGAMLSAQMRQ